MNNKEVIERLYETMAELQGILKENKAEELSQLEIDLSRDKLKKMYDILINLEATPGLIDEPKEETQAEIVEEITLESKLDLDVNDMINEMESSAREIESGEIIGTGKSIQEKQEVLNESETHTEDLIVEEIEPEDINISNDEPEEEEVIKAGDVLDLFNEGSESDEKVDTPENKFDININEEETVADKLQKSKLESVKSAIGINEKFFFLNELFKGDLQTYNDNIEKLDSMKTRDEAFLFLSDLANEFGWNDESEAVDQITQMLENKFS